MCYGNFIVFVIFVVVDETISGKVSNAFINPVNINAPIRRWRRYL